MAREMTTLGVLRRVIAGGASLAAAVALAAPSSPVAWTLETVRAVRHGDPARGKILNKDCADCHGAEGTIDTPDVPNLAGQSALYVYKQLRDYKAGTRSSSIMNDAVASLSEKDMTDLAAFYASLSPAHAPAPTSVPPAAKALATVGDGSRLIVACDACHGDRGAGNPGFYGMPSLRGQKYDDLHFELLSFRSGDRGNDVYRVMRDPVRALTDAEIDALCSYYSGVPVKAIAKVPPKP
jgi:cytochrome c553